MINLTDARLLGGAAFGKDTGTTGWRLGRLSVGHGSERRQVRILGERPLNTTERFPYSLSTLLPLGAIGKMPQSCPNARHHSVHDLEERAILVGISHES